MMALRWALTDITFLQEALEASWGPDTHQSPKGWNKMNPAQGQCCVSSLIVQEHFGGVILRGETNKGTVHYWNGLGKHGGGWYDATHGQFWNGEYVQFWRIAFETEYLFKDTLNKVDILRGRVNQILVQDECEIPL